tara:strand:- start:680 stop:865 length:186 start_codon:yes stop_codon:yes gene_type:complete
MKKLEVIVADYKTNYQAAKALKVTQAQLTRWLKNDALIDKDGGVFIRTKGTVSIKQTKKGK